MPSIGSTTRTIRFSPEDLEIIEDLMKKEDTTFNKAVHLLISGVVHPKNTVKVVPSEEKTDLSDLSEMAELMRVTTEKILADIKTLIEDGTLYYENGRLVNPRYDELERICERKKIDIDNLISKVIRDVENGK